jgi:hypothetical protein
MLNSKEYLLICFIEELGEIQKEASKCLRFGLNHKEFEESKSNLERLCDEWSELNAILKLMKEYNINIQTDPKTEENKLKRFEYYWNFSKHRGIVDEYLYSR